MSWRRAERLWSHDICCRLVQLLSKSSSYHDWRDVLMVRRYWSELLSDSYKGRTHLFFPLRRFFSSIESACRWPLSSVASSNRPREAPAKVCPPKMPNFGLKKPKIFDRLALKKPISDKGGHVYVQFFSWLGVVFSLPAPLPVF